jgi:hypothetical protein
MAGGLPLRCGSKPALQRAVGGRSFCLRVSRAGLAVRQACPFGGSNPGALSHPRRPARMRLWDAASVSQGGWFVNPGRHPSFSLNQPGVL